MSTVTANSSVSFLPWVSGESLSPARLNAHQSELSMTVTLDDSDLSQIIDSTVTYIVDSTITQILSRIPTVANSNVIYDAFVNFGTANSGVNNGDTILTPLVGVVRGGFALSGTLWNAVFQQPGTTNATSTLSVYNNRRTLRPIPSLTKPDVWFWRPGTNAQNPIPFSDTFFSATTSLATTAPAWPKAEISAWIRKHSSGDSSDANFLFGFTSFRIISPSASIPRIGLVGDGVGGYRFGSINCPDGSANTNNSPTDIDSGFTQPAQLVSPGTNWFKATITLVPASAYTAGYWVAGLNDVSVATFSSVSNMPRGYFSGAPTNDGFRTVEAAFGSYFSSGYTTVTPVITDIRFRLLDNP